MLLANGNPDVEKKLNSMVFPGTQGGPLMHVIAAKAVAFLEALPTMSQQDYAGLVMQTLMKGDSHDHGR